MSIPLDRLYHYIESIAQEVRKDNVVIYRFFPHGSKKLEDLTLLNPDPGIIDAIAPHLYCHDQEPLFYDLYANKTFDHKPEYKKILVDHKIELPDLNFKRLGNIYDQSLLLHSEKRSQEVEKYRQRSFIPVYYWSHAVLARDWFRYAQHVKPKKNVQQKFLIYNRAWSGTREYRLGFAQRIIWTDLVNDCRMRISPVDSTLGKHYDLHEFERPEWRPVNVLEKHFPLCHAESHYSADFDLDDYAGTDIEVVLETLFDDNRLHLTEKTLRPIAMGQPFILAGTYGSLKYLRDYGFKTFSDCWDESYDLMTDSVERMNKIVDVMKNITCIAPFHRERILAQAQEIADYNRQHFFSDQFQTMIKDELQNNLKTALQELEETNTSKEFFAWRKTTSSVPALKELLITSSTKENWVNSRARTRQDIADMVKKARQYYMRSLKPYT